MRRRPARRRFGRPMRTSILVLLLATTACRDARSSDADKRRAPTGLPPASAAPSPERPAAPPEERTVTVAGALLERIDAPPYSYLKIGTSDGEKWAAVNQTEAAVGTQVSVTGALMQGFESKTLSRKFDEIVFGTLGSAAAPAQGHTTSAVTRTEKVPIAEGPGATTIAELFAGKAGLAGKEVAVRGKVVKLNSGILGKTWLHLQDGSGSPATGDHDLAVTTTDTVKLDEVVTARGAVHLDRDFGAGYRYDVILEDAKLAR